MKTIIFTLAIICSLFTSTEVFAFKVMTFNIWTGKSKKIDDFIAIIKKADADIVIINEANDPETFYQIADQLKYERVLAVHNKYNVGILSKFKIESYEFFLLENLSKSLVEVKVNVPGLNKPLWVFASHLVALNLNRRNKKRAIEIESILPYIKKRLDDHVVFAGDMNEESHLDKKMPKNCISRAITDLGLVDSYRNYFKSTEVAPGFTHNILVIPTKRIDYIYVSNQLEVLGSETLGKKYYQPWPSDHAALITELKLKEPVYFWDATTKSPKAKSENSKNLKNEKSKN